MILFVDHSGHPYKTRKPPPFTVVEAPTLRECVGLFESQTGWTTTMSTSCCGPDFAVYAFDTEPAEWENPGWSHFFRKIQPVAAYSPTYFRAQDLPPEAVLLDDERWEYFCSEFNWIAKTYGFDEEGKPVV